jgi:hypothetical protein
MTPSNPLTCTTASRRRFLASAGALAAASMAGCGGKKAVPVLNDNDVLNFALNLEYLEAEFYLIAATGSGLASADTGKAPGGTTGGTKVPGLNAAQQRLLNEIAFDEQSHVQYLRATIKKLGGAPVDKPAIDLTFFGPFASSAGIPGSYNPFTDFNSLLVGAFTFEDVGVTAYNGATNILSNAGLTAGYFDATAGILPVEAYHAAYVRATLTANAVASPGYPYLAYANQISALRASLGGGKETTLIVPTSTSTPSAVTAADSNALAYTRTTDQILHILYGSATVGVAKGGFFPAGVNFKFAATTT